MSGTEDSSAAELSVCAHAAQFRRASVWLEEACRERGVPAEQVGRLDICLNEALANIAAHGGEAAPASPVRVLLDVRRDPPGGEAAVTVVDAGAAFDPVAFTPRARPATLDEAVPGGLGVVMMRSFSDALSYDRANGLNRLTFRVRWPESS